MKIRYPQKNRWGRGPGGSRFLIGAMFAVALFITIDLLSPNFWWGVTVSVGRPMWYVREKTITYFDTKLALLSSKRELTKENSDLISEIESLRGRLRSSESTLKTYLDKEKIFMIQ